MKQEIETAFRAFVIIVCILVFALGIGFVLGIVELGLHMARKCFE